MTLRTNLALLLLLVLTFPAAADLRAGSYGNRPNETLLAQDWKPS